MSAINTIYLKETKEVNGGVQRLYSFPNGFGASVIKHKGSYGFESGKWELAVLKGEDICYDTPITSDVLGHLNDPEVDRYLKQISDLEPVQQKEGSFYGYKEKHDNFYPELDD